MRENVKAVSGVLSVLLLALIAAGQWWLSLPPLPPVVPDKPPVVAPVTPPVTPQPAPVTPPVPVPGVEPALVIVTDRDGKRITDAAVEAVAGKLAVGVWTVVAIPQPGDKGWRRAITVADWDQPIPVPPAPVPPAPTPGPLPLPPVVPPVVPNPPPSPSPPLPLAGMRVLVIYETDAPLPKSYLDAMNSRELRAYLDQKCLKGPGGHPEWRMLDDDPSFAGAREPWQKLRAALPSDLSIGPEGFSIPTVAIGDSAGVVVHSGPWPEADALALFRIYGGP